MANFTKIQSEMYMVAWDAMLLENCGIDGKKIYVNDDTIILLGFEYYLTYDDYHPEKRYNEKK